MVIFVLDPDPHFECGSMRIWIRMRVRIHNPAFLDKCLSDFCCHLVHNILYACCARCWSASDGQMFHSRIPWWPLAGRNWASPPPIPTSLSASRRLLIQRPPCRMTPSCRICCAATTVPTGDGLLPFFCCCDLLYGDYSTVPAGDDSPRIHTSD